MKSVLNNTQFSSENFLIVICFISLIVYILYNYIKRNEKNFNSYIDNKYNFGIKTEECPPFYPNGWLPVLESRDLAKSQVKPIFAFGNDLVAFRGESGKVYVLDAYCLHLGANLGVGGAVIGEEIKCPFHGWKFNNKGNCTEVPGIECSNIPKANLKVWDSHEVNGFIFVWNHSNGEKPNWFIKPIKDIESKQYVFRGKCEHIVNCHIQEILENNADVMHLGVLHSAPEFMEYPIKGSFNEFLLKYINIETIGKWNPCSDWHLSELNTFGSYNLWIWKIRHSIESTLIGPALTHVRVKMFGKIYVHSVSAAITIGPTEQRFVHHYYTQSFNIISYFLSKFWPIAYSGQLERDVIIWNNKKYMRKPHLAKNESALKGYRRWYKQFYSDHKLEN